MEVTPTSSDGLKREFRIVIGKGDIEEKVSAKLAHLSHSVVLPGFRPGKVPVSLLRKRFGRSVLGEVLEEAVNAGSQKAIGDHQLTPAMPPKIEVTKFAEGEDLEYTVALEVMPEIVPADFKSIKLEKMVLKVPENEVEEALKRLAEQQRSFEAAPAEAAAQDGDAVLIDFVGSIEGTPFEGGSGEGFLLELGSKRFIPGFEEQLVGAKAGDARTVKVDFPAEYPAQDLAGKAAEFAVTVKEVRRPNAVPIDDDLAKLVGMDNLDALKTAVRGQIEREYSQLTRARLKRGLLDVLAEKHDFEVPEGMVDAELGAITDEFKQAKEQGTVDAEDAAKSEDEFKTEYRPIAERRVRLGLLLGRVGEMNNLTVQDAEVSRALTETARQFPGRERQVMEFYQGNPQAMAQLKAPLYEDKVVDFIIELADVTERQVEKDELLRDPDEAKGESADGGDKGAAKGATKGRTKRAAEGADASAD